jgi:hypothetical protein
MSERVDRMKIVMLDNLEPLVPGDQVTSRGLTLGEADMSREEWNQLVENQTS